MAYIACKKECYIYLVNTDGSGLTQLTTDPVAKWLPAWSPDGQQIAFVRPTPGAFTVTSYFSVNLINTHGTGLVAIGPGERSIWSPGGSRVAYMDADGSHLNWLTNKPASDTDPAWSPDGQKVVFVSYRDDKKGDLCIINTDGSGLVRLTDG